ncbi:unnamed protein product [Rotaria magnacalcarata]|uniref:Uncharacterized protein n=1 Tax=Rotaria magnacalcarata TaxID=392030 RepID=A0A816MCY6_9BILA|nr:unnamed protein product [Rotaria magnacalcarata]CAF1524172.1 unnamed protein product [Rotaria magnacalcarata]CAF1972297.1 unnamed protein product [Rotaria magnacalcarata]CAF2037689.1 unnamed protein product [Rotaria magnacalcarata]CAF3788078.1 unnamed protein product [Rotaria magnacalcarata]
MNDHTGESSTTTKTFRFGSGQLLILNQYQIEKIPYLTALVSAGPSFDSIQLKQGYYLLDSRIAYQDFLFALDSLSFDSIRKIFTHLPKNYNVLANIALLEFLVLGQGENPTLNEVNSNFFCNVEFGDKLGAYKYMYRPSDIQDMAVRFAIALAKEEYDFRNHQVADQIYWFIMFILSAYELFDTHIRYHVHKIAQNCFSLFCPSLLKRLHRLEERTGNEIRDNSNTASNHINSHEEKDVLCSFDLFPNDCSFDFWHIDYLCSVRRFGLTFNCCNCKMMFLLWIQRNNYSFFRNCRKIAYDKDKILEALCEKILENMYKCLLGTVIRQLLVKKHGHGLVFFRELKYKQMLDDILNSNAVQVAIKERILSEICELIPKLEQKHSKLMKEIEFNKQHSTITCDDEWQIHIPHMYWNSYEFAFESKRNIALKCELTLAKLYQYESLIDEIRNTILVDLHDLFMDEIKIFVGRRKLEWSLFNNLLCNLDKKIEASDLKKTHRMYSNTNYRSLPKIQFKYTKCKI